MDRDAFASTQAKDQAADDDVTKDDDRPIEARVAAPIRLLARYDLGRILGEGGMGEVHECKDIELDRTIALKAIRRDRQAKHLEARFIREACVQAQLEHPAVVPVFDVGREEGGSAFFTMRRVSGMTLDEIIELKRAGDPRMITKRSETFSRHRLLTAFAQICLTVHYAHSRGILHRDIKPSNIMLGEFGEVYVLDWGLAKLGADGWVPAASESSLSVSASHQTVAGTALGTPAYMAPEQLAGKEVDARADVFALGAVLFEILTLERMLDENAIEARLRGKEATWDARATVRFPGAQVPPEFDRICTRATAPVVNLRIASARTLYDLVEAYLEGERDHELRRTQANTLIERAASNQDRDEAFRDVNRALALSPDNPRALELLVGLLNATPSAATKKAEEDVLLSSTHRQKRIQQLGALMYVVPWFTLYPLVLFLRGTTSLLLACSIPVAWLAAGFGLYVDSERDTNSRIIYPTVLVMIAVALTSAVFGPLLFTPTLCATCVTAHILVAARWVRFPTVALGIAVSIGTMLPVWLGLWHVYEFKSETTFTMAGLFETIIPNRLVISLSTVDVLMILGLGIAAYRFRDDIEHARTQNFLFAWQLSKLLPKETAEERISLPAPEAVNKVAMLDTEVDSVALRAVTPTALTRAQGDESDADPLPLLALDGSRYVDAVESGDKLAVRDRVIGREVAMLRSGGDPDFLRRAIVQARVEHPAVPPVYDIGPDWFTTKLVKGKTLAESIGKEPVPRLIGAFAKVCLAIDFAHEHGIVHRGLALDQIVLGEFGETWIIGWEHAGEGTERQLDIAALGAILFEVASGKPPSSGAHLPPVLDRICTKATTDRYATARKLHDDVEAYLGSDRDEEMRRGLAAERVAKAEKNLAAAQTDEKVRVQVLRDIGRALALAPDRSPALRVLGRLLDSPPSPLPREVQSEIREQVWALSKKASPSAALIYVVAFVVAFPIFSFIVGIRDPLKMVGIVVAWALAALAVYGQHLSKKPLHFPVAGTMALVAVATTSLFLGPYFMIPGLAVTITMIYVLAVQVEWRRYIITLGCASLLVPAILIKLRLLDVLDLPGELGPKATFVILGADYHPPHVFLVGLVIVNILNVIVGGFYGARYRDMLDKLEAENRSRVHGLSRLM